MCEMQCNVQFVAYETAVALFHNAASLTIPHLRHTFITLVAMQCYHCRVLSLTRCESCFDGDGPKLHESLRFSINLDS